MSLLKNLRFDFNYSLANDHTKYPQPVVNFDLNNNKKVHVTYSDGMK